MIHIAFPRITEEAPRNTFFANGACQDQPWPAPGRDSVEPRASAGSKSLGVSESRRNVSLASDGSVIAFGRSWEGETLSSRVPVPARGGSASRNRAETFRSQASVQSVAEERQRDFECDQQNHRDLEGLHSLAARLVHQEIINIADRLELTADTLLPATKVKPRAGHLEYRAR